MIDAYHHFESQGDTARAANSRVLARANYNRAREKRLDAVAFLRGFGIEPDNAHTNAINVLDAKIRAL